MLSLPSETMRNIKPQDDHKRPTQAEKRWKLVIRFYYLSSILGSQPDRGSGVGTPGLRSPATATPAVPCSLVFYFFSGIYAVVKQTPVQSFHAA